MFVKAKVDFMANKLDVKEGTLFWVEDDEVMINNQFFCEVDSPNFHAYFEIVA